MIHLDPAAQHKPEPKVSMAPLIDVVFITLIFYMTLSIFYQLETELSISVPKSEQSQESERSPGEIIINVSTEGDITINQRTLSPEDLETMLTKLSGLYPNQPVIIRADEETRHRSVVKVLDACAAADIWNIAFATLKNK